MPCIDYRNGDGAADADVAAARSETTKANRKIARLEALLCSACTLLEQADFLFSTNTGLDEWWDAHKKADARKAEAAERAAQKIAFEKRVLADALKKPFGMLSREEKDMLRKHKFL